jgi:diguanylate cyclase (GGDEF)-like protein
MLTPVAILVLDLDGFKAVNDSVGHVAGDRLLRELAAVLRHAVRDSDDVFRIGGDEFAVFAPAGDLAETEQLAERIVNTVREQTTVTVSIGVGLSKPHETLTQTLLRADRALYAAKAAGRDRVVLAPPPT